MQRGRIATLLRGTWRGSWNRQSSSLASFATVDPQEISGQHPVKIYNLVAGKWNESAKWDELVDPLNGESFIRVPNTSRLEVTVWKA